MSNVCNCLIEDFKAMNLNVYDACRICQNAVGVHESQFKLNARVAEENAKAENAKAKVRVAEETTKAENAKVRVAEEQTSQQKILFETQKLKSQQSQTTTLSCVLSRADYYNSLESTNRVQFFDPRIMVEVKTCSEVFDFQHHHSEIQIQEFVDSKIEHFMDGHKDIKISKTANAHNKQTLGKKCPDEVFHVANQFGESSIVLVGEVKKVSSISNIFNAEMRGQVLDYAYDILKKFQPLRRFLFLFLTTGFHFEFYRVEPDFNPENPNGIFCFKSTIFTGMDGWNILFSYLRLNEEQLGHTDFSNTKYQIIGYLGSGSSCKAYSCCSLPTGSKRSSDDQQSYVMKISQNADQFANETAALHLLRFKPVSKHVPTIIEQISFESSHLLVVSPVGTKLPSFSCDFTSEHAGQLVDVLMWAHENGLIHRDVKPRNMFLHPDQNQVLILNDWGSSVVYTALDISSLKWVGTPSFSLYRITNWLETHTCSRISTDSFSCTVENLKAEDLYSAILSCFYCFKKSNFHGLEFNQIVQYWDKYVLNPQSIWHSCFAYARNLDYDNLKNTLQALVGCRRLEIGFTLDIGDTLSKEELKTEIVELLNESSTEEMERVSENKKEKEKVDTIGGGGGGGCEHKSAK